MLSTERESKHLETSIAAWHCHDIQTCDSVFVNVSVCDRLGTQIQSFPTEGWRSMGLDYFFISTQLE